MDEIPQQQDTPAAAPATGAIETPAPTAPAPVSAISERMTAAAAGGPTAVAPDTTVPEEPAPFDLSKLRPEQLQQLKAMLASTPERAITKRGNPIVLLRRLDGQFIVDFKDAVNTLVRNPATNFTEEVLVIPVKFLGDTEFKQVNYRDFMNADQVKCQVINISRKEEWVHEAEGEPVISKENGRPVERGYTVVKEVLTVRLPEGTQPETADVEGKIANA